jgi:hypothetical protein
MSDTNEPWFVTDRSEALAGVLLTARADVRVRSAKKVDGGADFLVEINRGEPLSTRLFVVQVRGTTSPNPDDWTETAKPLFRAGGNGLYLPVCVFVVSVRDNRGAYAWLAEPLVQPQGAKLQFRSATDAELHELGADAVNEIVERVGAWYDALPRQLQPA